MTRRYSTRKAYIKKSGAPGVVTRSFTIPAELFMFSYKAAEQANLSHSKWVCVAIREKLNREKDLVPEPLKPEVPHPSQKLAPPPSKKPKLQLLVPRRFRPP